MTFMKQSFITLAVLAGCVATIPACSSSPDTSSSTASDTAKHQGRIDLSLTVGSTTLTSIDMQIFTGSTATGTPIIDKTINLSSPSATISAFVGSLNAGGYTVQFTGANSCSGMDQFTIVAGTTITKSVVINCGSASVAPARGSAIINGQIVNASDCPYLTNTVAAPLQTDVGSSVDLSTVPAGTGAAAATVTWTEPGSSFTATGTSASYPCTAAGTHHLEVTLNGAAGTDQASCIETLTTTSAGNPSGLDIVCVGGGAGGSTGAGGTTSAGGTTETGGTTSAGGTTEAGGTTSAGGTTEAGGTTSAGGSTGVTSQYCTNPGQVLSDPARTTTECDGDGDTVGCLSNNCDAPFFSGCGASSDPATCNAILACYRSTNCIQNGITVCYCGDATVDSCTAAGGGPVNGACTAAIAAGFPAGTTPATIVGSFGNPATAGGFATGIGLCELNVCKSSCVPYCSP